MHRALPDTGAQCLALDPRAAGTVYVGTRGAGVLKGTDGGRSFADTGLPEGDVFAVAVSAADGALYAGCEPSRLFRSDDGGGGGWRELGALRRLPSAPTWSFPPRPWTSHVRGIAPSPHDAGRLLVGIELGGLMLSQDGGESWHDHPPGAQRDVHALAWHPRDPDRAYEAAGGGAAWSFDGGHSWRGADAGRGEHYVWGLAVDPADPDRWYVSAAPNPFRAHGRGRAGARIYRWEGDGPWRPLGAELDALPYALVAADGWLLAGLGNGKLLRSPDRGESWERLEPRLERVSALAVA